MTSRHAPLFADDKTAAQLFCMKAEEFRALVEKGHLPPPRDLGGFERWEVEELRRIAAGDAIGRSSYQW